MKPYLLEYLCCPTCKAELRLLSQSKEDGDIESGELVCKDNHSFPIKNFIPWFAPPEDYMEVFAKMRSNSKCDLPTIGDLDPQKITEEEFLNQTRTSPEELRGKIVLDAGCGGGRFMEVLVKHGATVIGIDLDGQGIAYAFTQLEEYPKAHFIQCNILNLPLRKGKFDFVYSLGVLHHTPDPKSAFQSLVPLLKKGGKIAVWVYPKLPTPLSDLLRPLTTKMSQRSLYILGSVVTRLYAPLLYLPVVGKRVRSILYRLRLPWHKNARWRLHSFLDWYGPKYQFKYSPEELKGWFTEAGLVDVRPCSYETSALGTSPN